MLMGIELALSLIISQKIIQERRIINIVSRNYIMTGMEICWGGSGQISWNGVLLRLIKLVEMETLRMTEGQLLNKLVKADISCGVQHLFF